MAVLGHTINLLVSFKVDAPTKEEALRYVKLFTNEALDHQMAEGLDTEGCNFDEDSSIDDFTVTEA